jgi:hypothetical protein
MAAAIPNYPVKVKLIVEVNMLTYGGNSVDSIENMKNNLASVIQNAVDSSNFAGSLTGNTTVQSVQIRKV